MSKLRKILDSDLPRRIRQISDYLVKQYTDTANTTLPPPVIVKGPGGTGKSWILNLIKQGLEKQANSNTYLVKVPLQLSAKNLVKTIVDEITAGVPNFCVLQKRREGGNDDHMEAA